MTCKKSFQPHIGFRNIQRGRCRWRSSRRSPRIVHRADRVPPHRAWGHFGNTSQRNQEDTHIWIPTPGPSRREVESRLKDNGQTKRGGQHQERSQLPHSVRCFDTDPDSCCSLRTPESQRGHVKLHAKVKERVSNRSSFSTH